MIFGRSLSMCIGAILDGAVRLADVGGIVASTRFVTDVQWDKGIRFYATSCWSYHSWSQITKVVDYLREHDKIIQPRLLDDNVAQSIEGGIWADTLVDALQSVRVNTY